MRSRFPFVFIRGRHSASSYLRVFASSRFKFFLFDDAGDRDDAPRLPGLRTWRSVYAAVIATLVVYIVGLALLSGLSQ